MLTHFWITGSSYFCNGSNTQTCPGELSGGDGHWDPFIDYVIVRYYLDGETTASLEFQPNMACGVGPFRSRTKTLYAPPGCADNTVSQDAAGTCAGGTGGRTPYVPGMANQTRAPWASKYFGKGSASGGWFWNVRVPFQRSLRVTLELPPVAGHPEVTGVNGYVQVRGVENLPISLGGIQLPSTARLRLQKIDAARYDALAWVPLLDVPSPARGAIVQNTLAVETADLNFQEGCVHHYSAHDEAFPGLIIATGLEDWYNSAYYFSAGSFTFPEQGQTWFAGGWNASHPGQWSAYRVHDSDPMFFDDGARLVWRVGDASKVIDGVGYKCLAPPGCPPSECPTCGHPTAATVWSYTYFYTW